MILNQISSFLATSVPSFWAPFCHNYHRNHKEDWLMLTEDLKFEIEVRKGLAFQAYGDHLVGF